MPYDERDEDTGEFKETFSQQDILDSLHKLSGAASTQEVADETGCAYRTAYQKLTELEDEDKIESRKVGNARLWNATSE